MKSKLIAIACLALLLPITTTHGPAITTAQYHHQNNLGATNNGGAGGGGAARDQLTYPLIRQQQQPANLYQQGGTGMSEAALANYNYQQQQQQHHQTNHQQQQHNQFLNQQQQQPPRLNQSPMILSANDHKATIQLNSILNNLPPNSPSIAALNGANILRQHQQQQQQQQQQLNVPIIPAPAAPHLTLNKFLPHNNINNNNNNNNNNNQANQNLQQQAHLLLQNQIGTSNKNMHGYIPLNSYHNNNLHQQQPPAINFASQSVNNRPNVSPIINNNNLLNLPIAPPRASSSQQQVPNINDDQRVRNSNRLSQVQSQNVGNNNQQNIQEVNFPQTNNQRQMYQVSNLQQSPASPMTLVSTPVPVQQQNNNNHILSNDTSFNMSTIKPNVIKNNDNNFPMKGSDNNDMMQSETKPSVIEPVTLANNPISAPAGDDNKRNDTLVSSASDQTAATTTTTNKDDSVEEVDQNNSNISSRPSNTVLESSMPSLETSTSSSATTPPIDQSPPTTSKLTATSPLSTMMSATPLSSTATTKQSGIDSTDWYPFDIRNSRFGPSRAKNSTTSIISEGVTLQPAPDILTVPPDYNPDARNQSSYEIVVSQQMGAPSNINRGSILPATNETVFKKKIDQNDVLGQKELDNLPLKSTTLIQPTATTTIIWSSSSLPAPGLKHSIEPSTTIKNNVAPTQINSRADSPADPVDEAPVVYGKPLSQARPAAPMNSAGQNSSSSSSENPILAPSPITGQANIETSVPAVGKPFIVPVAMDEVRPYTSTSQHSGQSRTSANNHHGMRHPSMAAPAVSRSGGGPVMQIGSGLTVTAVNNDTAASNLKRSQPPRNLLGGGQHSDFMTQHKLNFNSARSGMGAQSQPSISSSFQVSNSAPNEDRSSGNDLTGDIDSFDLNSDSSNNEQSHTNHPASTNNVTTSITTHTVVRRPPFRPRPPIPIKIDTCILGDNTSCDQSHNERCIEEFGITSCHCRPGFARTSQLRGPCKLSNSFGVILKVDKLTDRKLVFNSTLTNLNSTEYQYLEYESLQAIGTAFQQTKFANYFMGAKVNKFFSNQNSQKIYINMTVHLESNNETQSQHIKLATQQELLRVADIRQRNLGDSNLWLDSTPNAITRLEDINECASKDLNDCHHDATCTNDFGTFQCQCLPGHEDLNPGDRGKSGRKCFGCSPSYCSNRGECFIVDGQKQCKCKANFIGSRCDIDGEVMAVAVGGSLTALIIFIITFWCLYVYNQRWKQEQQKIDAMSATSGLTFSYVNSSTNNLMSAFSHHQQASDQQAMLTSGSSSGGGPSARSMNLGSSLSSHQTSPSNQSFAGGIVGIAGAQNGMYGGHTMRGVNGGYTLSGHHHGYGGGTTKSNYIAQLHHHNGSANNYRTMACNAVPATIYGMGQEAMTGQPAVRHDKSRVGNCYYLSPEMLVNQQQQHHHLYSSPQQRMINNHSPTLDINGNQYLADDRELCIDTSGATVGMVGPVKRGGGPRNQSYHHQNLIFNQQQSGHHNQGRQGATMKSKSRSSNALNAQDRIGYNQMAGNGGIYNETEFSSRDVYMPQYLMNE